MEGPSTNLIINGVTYPYPLPDATNWGQEASNWAIAVTYGMLQKTGGLFSLQSDLNFGSNYGVFAPYFGNSVGTHATSGVLRLSHGDLIAWRNQTNTADVTFGLDGTTIQINGAPAVSVNASGGTTGMSFTGGPVTSTGTLTLTGTLNVANGGTGATTLSGLVYGNGTGPLTTVTPDVLGKVLMSTGVSTPPEWTTISGVGTVVQVNTGTGLTGGPFTSSGTIQLNSASIASLALADSSIQPGDNVTELVNNANYLVPGNNISLLTNNSGYVTSANVASPSASIGLSAVNGAATTFMRSDAAPALSQTIAPTWTGTHAFTKLTRLYNTLGSECLRIGGNTSTDPYMSFFAPNGTTRRGYIQALATGHLLMNAETGELQLQSSNTSSNIMTRFMNGAGTTVAGVRGDGWITTAQGMYGAYASQYFELGQNTVSPYGSTYVSGARGSYSGIMVHDGAIYPHLMSNGTSAGIYNWGDGQWLIYRSASNVAQCSYPYFMAPNFRSTSSRTLKDEVDVPLNASEILSQLRPVVYTLKDDEEKAEQLGLIAEEVHEVSPWLSADGKSVAYDRLAILLLKVLQEKRIV